MTVEITTADPRTHEAAELIRALSAELAMRYNHSDDGSGNFRPEDVLVPGSAFLIARTEGRAVACGAFRPMQAGVAEIKRMYVLPAYRGRGFSKMVLSELERLALASGYVMVRLETGDAQPEAIGLYERSGYCRIPNFGVYEDSPRSVCFEKALRAQQL